MHDQRNSEIMIVISKKSISEIFRAANFKIV